jgi:hypothetical protein
MTGTDSRDWRDARIRSLEGRINEVERRLENRVNQIEQRRFEAQARVLTIFAWAPAALIWIFFIAEKIAAKH